MGHHAISLTMSAELPPRTLRLKLDTEALAGNWRALDAMSGEARAGAAVKANCYGLGVECCVPILRDAGAREFFVAHWSEIQDVLKHVGPEQVSVLHGPTNAQEVAYAQSIGVRPVIDSVRQARLWTDGGGGACDLMVDTGINRLGIAPSEIADPVIQALDVQVLMSHLACADENSPMNQRQLRDFISLRGQIRHREVSLANSAGIALGTDYAFDLTRPGLSLYGGIPRPELAGAIQQVAYPQAAIIQRRTLQEGDAVGYNATFVAKSDMTVGVVSLGYADGYLRSWGAKGALRHEDRDLRLLGKVSMDMVVVDLTNASELQEGDWLDVPYHLPDAARQSTVSQYELLTVLGNRFGQ